MPRPFRHLVKSPPAVSVLSRCGEVASNLTIAASRKFRSQKSDIYAKRDASRGFTDINGDFTMSALRSILMVTSNYAESPASRSFNSGPHCFDTFPTSRDWHKRFAFIVACGRVENPRAHRSCAAAGTRLAVSVRRRLIDFRYFTDAELEVVL